MVQSRITGGTLVLNAGSRVVAIDLPHLLLLAGLGGFCIWYLLDSRAASTDVQNLLLIEPVALLGLVLILLIMRTAVTVVPGPHVASPRECLPRSTFLKVLGSMLLLGGYVALAPYLGFDVTTAAYVCGNLWVLGERRPALLIGVPLLFAFVVTQLFRMAVSTPLPMLLHLA